MEDDAGGTVSPGNRRANKSRNQARAEYEAVLYTWKNADPELPLYQQARRELRELH